MVTITPTDQKRFSLFVQENFKTNLPHFWDGFVIIPFYPFEVHIKPSEEVKYCKWEASFHYEDEHITTIFSNEFSPHFANEIKKTKYYLENSYRDKWKNSISEIRDHLTQKHSILLEEIACPYEIEDPDSPHYGDLSLVKYSAHDGDLPDFEYSIIIFFSLFTDPVLVLESEHVKGKRVFSLKPKEQSLLEVKKAIDLFLEKVNSSSSLL